MRNTKEGKGGKVVMSVAGTRCAIESYLKCTQDILYLDSSINQINLLLISIYEASTFCFGLCLKQSMACQPNLALCLFS